MSTDGACKPPAPPLWRNGWYRPARAVESPNFNQRPPGACVELVVIHNISLPPDVFRGDAIERLFTNTLDFAAHPYYAQIGRAHV